jgi:hypothetical protein
MDIYLLIEGKQEGPYTEEQIRESLTGGRIPNDLPAWHQGLSDWMQAKDILLSLPHPSTLPPAFKPFSTTATLSVTVDQTKAVIQTESRPWYRSVAFVGLLIGIPASLMLIGSLCFVLLNNTIDASSPNVAILTALQQDDQLGKEYKSERMGIHDSGATGDDALDQVARLTSNLVAKMKAIPISDCPADFQEAYTRHINCWSDDADAIAQHPHIQSGDEALLEGFLRGLAGDPTGGAFEKQYQIDSYLKTEHDRSIDIKRSWEDVEAVATRYGVHPSDYSSN